jgi:hypothetical protein
MRFAGWTVNLSESITQEIVLRDFQIAPRVLTDFHAQHT